MKSSIRNQRVCACVRVCVCQSPLPPPTCIDNNLIIIPTKLSSDAAINPKLNSQIHKINDSKKKK